MKTRKTLYLTLILSLLIVTGLVSCTQGTRKKAILENFCDNMYSSYTAEIFCNLSSGDFTLCSDAIITKEKANIKLQLLSPEPYNGMIIDYDVTGAPESVAVHFSGVDTTLPALAVAKVNSIVQLFSEEFLRLLSTQSTDKITEIENVSSGQEEYFIQVPFGSSLVGVRFSGKDAKPLYFEFGSEELSGDITIKSFEVMYENK